MNSFKKTENELYRYKALKAHLDKLKLEYKELEEIADGTAIEYDADKLCETYAFSSSTEDIALKLYTTSIKIKHYINRIMVMEKSLEILNNTEKEVIDLKYFNNSMHWFDIAYKVQYSERQCIRIRDNAVNKISIVLFGEPNNDGTFMSLSFNKTVV